MLIVNRKDENRVIGNQIDRVGAFVCKIDSVLSDGATSQGDLKIKFNFSVLVGKDELMTYSESFPVTGKASFLINRFEDAMRTPDSYNAEDLVGRYVTCHFGENHYTDKTGAEKTNIKATKWDYSDVNDKKGLAPIKEAKEVVIDIDSDEVPF